MRVTIADMQAKIDGLNVTIEKLKASAEQSNTSAFIARKDMSAAIREAIELREECSAWKDRFWQLFELEQAERSQRVLESTPRETPAPDSPTP